MRDDWCREAFPIAGEQAYLNNAATVPMHLDGTRAVNEYLNDRQRLGAGATPKWNGRCRDVRAKLARLVGCRDADIALTSGTSHGLSLVAAGLDWRDGDEVVVIAPDFTANLYPWMHLADRGVTVRVVERSADGSFSPERVVAAFTPATRMLAVTSVDFHTGFYADLPALGALCRERSVLFGVDAIQSLGVAPLDVAAMHVDFLACGAHKWLLGSQGGGFLYVSEALRPRVRPTILGWNSVRNPEAYAVEHELREDAGKYEPGTPPYLVMAILEAGLDMLLSLGVDNVRHRVLALTDAARHGVEDLGWPVVTVADPERRAGILTFTPPGDPETLLAHLAERGVIVSVRRGAVRVSPNFYNNQDDIDRLLAALGDWRG